MSHTMHGKWSEPNVPHRGWECIGIEDVGEPSHLCEMCMSMLCRFVHSMQHPDYPEVLQTGCVCAGNMEGDIDAARQREQQLKRIKTTHYGSSPAAVPRIVPQYLPRATLRPGDAINGAPGWFIKSPGVAYTAVGDFEITVFWGRGVWESQLRRRGSNLVLASSCSPKIEDAVQFTFSRIAVTKG